LGVRPIRIKTIETKHRRLRLCSLYFFREATDSNSYGRASILADMSFLIVIALVVLGAVLFGALLIALAEYTVSDMPADQNDQNERSNVHEFRRRP
jgi:hypothetical protein